MGSKSSLSTYTTSADMTTAAAISIAPPATRTLVIESVTLSVGTAMSFEVEEETTGTVKAGWYLPANGTVTWTPPGGISLDTQGKRLFGQAGAAGNVRVTVSYRFD